MAYLLNKHKEDDRMLEKEQEYSPEEIMIKQLFNLYELALNEETTTAHKIEISAVMVRILEVL